MYILRPADTDIHISIEGFSWLFEKDYLLAYMYINAYAYNICSMISMKRIINRRAIHL